MSELEKLVKAFETMDADAREYTLKIAVDQAEMWPAVKPLPQPVLRLVIGDSK